jgi:hypothetical protein
MLMCRLISFDFFFSLTTTDDKRARRWSILIQLLFYERKYNKYFCDFFKENKILNSIILTCCIVYIMLILRGKILTPLL